MFDSLHNRIFAALAAIGMLVASFLFGYGLGRDASVPDAPSLGIIEEVEGLIRSTQGSDVDQRALIQGAVRGMLESLGDPYAEYLDRRGYVSFDEFTKGEFRGVGMLLKDEEGEIKVVSVLPGTPADKAGIRGGDVLLEVDGEDIAGESVDAVADDLRGDPGTSVTVALRRGEETLTHTLIREQIALPSVESSLEGGLGRLRVITFSGGSGADLREATASLVDRGAEGLILDLRGNPGGLVDEAVRAAGVFLDGGVVVTYRERGRAEVVHTAPAPQGTTLPLVVLVDEGSASASEILAGALQDRGRAILVGSQTYGKSSIQQVFPLSDGSAVKLTVASYHLPNGEEIGEEGIAPDVSVMGQSDQLARARRILQQMLAAA